MTAKDFEEIVTKQLEHCREVLCKKADEYAPGADRLSNFKIGATLKNSTPMEVCGGLMCKHIVALYDFLGHDEKSYTRWEEKITDTINYLLLLEALIVERGDIF